ncbi:glycosyltransferase family 4 protein, partial [Candidatus Pacearchaeota archaeon]|nr:glycosyltransferase family 4 protein [Candidatus Pacearchaeota archaeon]
NKKINILCCGKRGGAHKGNKGTHDIIEASKLLDKNKYNFIYFDLTKQGFPDYFKIIETLSNQNTLRDVYALADIYIAPDYVSAWNCCAGEAMACKKPVIASTKGIDDFGKDGDTCLIYEENRPDSPEVLAGKIEMLADDIDLRNKIAKNGYENIKNFTWDKVAERIVDMAKDLGIKV